MFCRNAYGGKLFFAQQEFFSCQRLTHRLQPMLFEQQHHHPLLLLKPGKGEFCLFQRHLPDILLLGLIGEGCPECILSQDLSWQQCHYPHTPCSFRYLTLCSSSIALVLRLSNILYQAHNMGIFCAYIAYYCRNLLLQRQ